MNINDFITIINENNLRTIVTNGSIGDFIALDSKLSQQEKNEISCICHISHDLDVIPIIKDLSFVFFENLQKFYSLWDFIEDKLDLTKRKDFMLKHKGFILKNISNANDHTVENIIQGSQHYKDCTLLRKSLFTLNKQYTFDLDNFAFIHPCSKERQFSTSDWTSIISNIKNTQCVVFGTNPNIELPSQVASMINQTTFFESIELLKKAKLFIGVSSCYSCAAAKLFSSENLHIVTNYEKTFQKNKEFFYLPHKQFDFLYFNNMPQRFYKIKHL